MVSLSGLLRNNIFKVLKTGSAGEPIEILVKRSTVVSQPNSDDESDYGLFELFFHRVFFICDFE